MLVETSTSIHYRDFSFLLLNGRDGLQAWVGLAIAHGGNSSAHIEAIHWICVALADRSSARVRVQLHPSRSGRRAVLRCLGWFAHGHRVLLLVVVQHVGEDVLRVLQPLRHFCVIAV